MKNFEKYRTNFGVIIDYYIRDCKQDKSFCGQCIFKEPCHNSNVDVEEWLFSEYKEPIKLSHDEYVILKNIHEEYKYISRDKFGDLEVFTSIPAKQELSWYGVGKGGCLFTFKHLFQFIQWSDEEPYEIAQLIGDYEKEHEDE